jgi:hypothetical protein
MVRSTVPLDFRSGIVRLPARDGSETGDLS